jgi:hypothetical protein
MAQTLGDKHYAPTVAAAIRQLRLRLRSHNACAALAEEATAVRAELKQKTEAWEDAVDEARVAAADVRYRDTRIDNYIKFELKAGVAVMTASMTPAQREAVTTKLYGGKSPSVGMKNVGGPIQDHYVDAILGHLATPEFASLAPHAEKITLLRAELTAAETNRISRRTAEQVARSALEDTLEQAKRFYNQMQSRLALLLPDDTAFAESCFLDLRGAAPDQGAESRKRALVAVYRARFGAIPREISAALEDDLDDAKFNKLVELFAIKSAEEIAVALLPPNR